MTVEVKGESLGAVLEQLRIAQQRTVSELAEAAGVDRSVMSRHLSGEVRCPPMNRLDALAGLLDVDVAELRRAAERDGCRYSEERAGGPDEAKPSPASGESREDFISRCMADSESRADFPDEDQRFAFCQSQWDNTRSKRNSGAQMETKSVPFECKVDASERIVEGYASTWDKDQVDDIILPGAFAKTIRERGGKVKVLWQHMDALGTPIHMEEDSTGLFTRSRISKTTLGDDALTLMADGVVDSMSIGFSIPNGKAEFEEDGWTRRISEVKLFEYSPVTFAANEAAVIQGVKHLYEQARKRGRDAFGNHEQELRTAIKNIEALLDGREPPEGTSDHRQPPHRPAGDPNVELRSALQSLGHEATAFALSATRSNLR